MTAELVGRSMPMASAIGRTWLVCEHGPIGARPLLAFGDALGRDTVLITTSLSSHLMARQQGRQSHWVSQWRRPAVLDQEADDLAEAEVARAKRFTRDVGPIREAVSAISERVDSAWRLMPPSQVVIWEQWTRALARVVVRRAIASDVSTFVVSSGPAEGVIQVDRVLGLRRQLLASRDYEASSEPSASLPWRRPSARSFTWNAQSVTARLGLHLDHLERSSRAVLGRPALIPLPYWAGYLRGRVRDRASIACNDTVPGSAHGLILLALHTPAALGRFADPLELVTLCLDHVASDRPLVICPHPGDRNLGLPRALWRRVRERPLTYLTRREPTWSLLRRASVLITLTSAVGCESLKLGVPTLAIAGAFYTGPGLAHPIGANGGSLIAAATANPERYRPDSARVNGFLRALVTDHLLPLAAIESDHAAVQRTLVQLDMAARLEVLFAR